MSIPAVIYKYRAFNVWTLEMLVSDVLFFADPRTFNDPLDTRPTVNADLGVAELQRVLTTLVGTRLRSEMAAAAKAIKFESPETILGISRQQARDVLAKIAYYAQDTDLAYEDSHRSLLGQHIEEELLRRYDRGIVSLAERPNCPLMWSHYADHHKGICVGYAVPSDALPDLHKVDYGGTRLVNASDVAAMLHGNQGARQKVDDAVLLKKAPAWRYEQEWRMTGQRGLQGSQLELIEVIFGLRCASTQKYIVARALKDREKSVKFFEMQEVYGTFELQKCETDASELTALLPRRHRSITEGFSDIASVLSAGDKMCQ